MQVPVVCCSAGCSCAVHDCAGDEALYKAASGPLDVMGKAKFFLGEEGKGANMKLVVNAVMGAMMASFAEGMSLTEQVHSMLQNGWIITLCAQGLQPA